MKFYEVMSQIVLTSHLVGFDLLTVSKQGLERDDAGAAGALPGRRRRGDRLEHAGAPEARGRARRRLQGARGWRSTRPTSTPSASIVQKKYLESDLAKAGRAGMVDKINAL